MNIVIVGGGLVGATLGAKLSSDGHDVSLVEGDPAAVRELGETLDAHVIQGNGTVASHLRKAGIEKADLLVATTNSDEVNMVVGLLGTAVFKVPRVVVRVRDEDHAESFRTMSAGFPGEHFCVNPQAAAVDRILSLLEVPGALDVVGFMGGRLLVAGFRILPSSDFAGLLLSHVKLMFPGTPTLVAAINRGEEWIIPHGEEEILVGDLVYFAIARQELESVLSLIGALQDKKRHIMLAGAGRIGLQVARRLEGVDKKVILIEESADLARRAADVLGKTLVIHGRVTDQSLLQQEGIERVATFVALTPDHEENLVSGLLAKRLGASRAFSLVDNPSLANLIGEVGIDAIISPRLLAVGLALQHIRRGIVRSVAALLEDKVEIVEAEAVAGSRLTSGTLAEIHLPRGVLVAAVGRGDEMLVPRGEARIQAGDQVLLITTTKNAPRLDAYLSP
jgi:trk system potassium uptake protein TrkA